MAPPPSPHLPGNSGSLAPLEVWSYGHVEDSGIPSEQVSKTWESKGKFCRKPSALQPWASYIFSIRASVSLPGKEIMIAPTSQGTWGPHEVMNAEHLESQWPLVPTVFDTVLCGGRGFLGRRKAEVVVMERYLLLFKIKIDPSFSGP